MLRNIKWGILGLGNIAHKFAADLQLIEKAELYAVASRSREKSLAFKEKFDAKIAYDSYLALIKDHNVDAIYIATPHAFHAEYTLLCLEHKKPVLCEKAFGMNLEEVTRMITVAKKHNILLMEALWTYFLPHYKYVLEVVKNKTLGEIKKLEADFGFQPVYNLESRLFKKEIGGGSLLDIGIYPVFAALSTLGLPTTIKANATFFETGVDATCNMTFVYNNTKAFLRSTLKEETKTEAVFTFSGGVLKIDSRFHQPSSVTILKDDKEETLEFPSQGFGYYYEILHFNELLRNGKTESNIMTFDFSKKLISTLDQIRDKIGLEY